MKRLYRFLVPVAVLAALLAFAPACGGDGGGDGGTDTVQPQTCDPVCDATACMTCNNGTCESTCVAGETCNAGTCEAVSQECDPACDAALCMTCNGTTCESTCTADQVCNAGTCEAAPECDPACDANACEMCDGTACVTTCAVGETCNAGTCEAEPCGGTCDANACEACVADECVVSCDGCDECDGAGNCATTCNEDTEFCNAADTCEEIPVVGCANPNAEGYCDASVVDMLAIAPAPNEATGEEGCCCDFNADGKLDNAVAGLVAQLGGFLGGLDLDTLNAMVAEFLGEGQFGVVFEYVGLADGAGDTPFFDMNFYLAGAACDPACDADACMECMNGTCVESCDIGEACDGAGACVALAACDPACDEALCMECVEGACVDACGAGFECVTEEDAGKCVLTDPFGFSGEGEFLVMPESLTDENTPLITFMGASVAMGILAAGPAQFVIPVSVPEYSIDIVLTIDEASIAAGISEGANGYELADGKICGYIKMEQIINALNGFVGGNCGCLNLNGDIIQGEAGAYACGAANNPNCDPNDDIESICPQITQFCGPILIALPMLLDIDADEDGVGDAISIGATFTGTSASIIGVGAGMGL